jgi:hypothetical protein
MGPGELSKNPYCCAHRAGACLLPRVEATSPHFTNTRCFAQRRTMNAEHEELLRRYEPLIGASASQSAARSS